MKAVKKFKNAVARRRPLGMDSILGKDTRIVQPPASMTPEDFKRPPLFHKTRSVDTEDRKPIEGALVAEGLHREIPLDRKEGALENREDSAVNAMAKSPTWASSRNSDEHVNFSSIGSKRDLNAEPRMHRVSHAATFPQIGHEHHGKGQAHNPLEDHLYLNLGPGSSSRPPSPPAVSESPPAAEIDIYETAYRKEVERLRAAQGRSATIFLTRRVEKMESSLRHHGLISSGSTPQTSFTKIIEAARSKAAKDVGAHDEQQQGEVNNNHEEQAQARGTGEHEVDTDHFAHAKEGLMNQAKSTAARGIDSMSGGSK